MQTDPELRDSTMARLATDWNESDADQDGKLNLAEYRTFLEKMKVAERDAGSYVRDQTDVESQ